MNNQTNKKQLDQVAKEAAETVAQLGPELPAVTIQRIYNEVVFELVVKTKLVAQMKRSRSDEQGSTKLSPTEEGPGQ